MGECLICSIVLVVKLLTGFVAFDPPVKDFAFGVSVVILDEAFVVQILKCVGASTALFSEQYTNDVFKTLRHMHFLCS